MFPESSLQVPPARHFAHRAQICQPRPSKAFENIHIKLYPCLPVSSCQVILGAKARLQSGPCTSRLLPMMTRRICSCACYRLEARWAGGVFPPKYNTNKYESSIWTANIPQSVESLILISKVRKRGRGIAPAN
jgi:hypothetical protein